MRVQPIPCLKDNYAYLVTCTATKQAALVDASEEAPVVAAVDAARAEGVTFAAIWSTHHHMDHVGGNEAVAARYGVPVFGFEGDRARIPGLSRGLADGERFALGELAVRVKHIPGHTSGAIAFVVEGAAGRAVFTGDTLFLAGCGRLFEGTPAQMHASLAWLGALAEDTRVYCGHEYTESNLRFALHCEPGNADAQAAARRAASLRAEGRPTVPGVVGDELRVNPFLRVGSRVLRTTLGIPEDADDVAAFAAVRKAKDGF